MVLNETFNVEINDEVFKIKVVEDTYGRLRIAWPTTSISKEESSKSKDFFDENGVGDSDGKDDGDNSIFEILDNNNTSRPWVEALETIKKLLRKRSYGCLLWSG